MNIKTVAVIGGGMMGRQIALGIAIHGFTAFVTDSNAAILDQVKAWAADYMAGRVAKGRMTQEKADEIMGRFTVTDTLEEAVRKVFDLRPTAIIRDLDLRKPIYRQLAAYGHMGREELGVKWESTERAEALKAAVAAM